MCPALAQPWGQVWLRQGTCMWEFRVSTGQHSDTGDFLGAHTGLCQSYVGPQVAFGEESERA